MGIVSAKIVQSIAGLVSGLMLAIVPAAAQDAEFKQMKLTEKHIQGFITAQKDLNDIATKLQASSDKPDPQLQAELEALAKKNGFSSFDELDHVAANISMVMAGIDPQSGEFTDPVESIKKEIEEIKADKAIPESDKKQMLEEMEEALKTTPPLEHPENVQIVKKYRVQIEKAME